MKGLRNIGFILLGIWLIAGGLIPLLHLSFSGMHNIMAIMAVAAGILVIIGR